MLRRKTPSQRCDGTQYVVHNTLDDHEECELHTDTGITLCKRRETMG